MLSKMGGFLQIFSKIKDAVVGERRHEGVFYHFLVPASGGAGGSVEKRLIELERRLEDNQKELRESRAEARHGQLELTEKVNQLIEILGHNPRRPSVVNQSGVGSLGNAGRVTLGSETAGGRKATEGANGGDDDEDEESEVGVGGLFD